MRSVRRFAYRSIIFITGIVLFASLPAFAVSQPNIGTVLEGAKPPAVEPRPDSAPRITIEEKPGAAAGGGGQTVMVRKFRIGGEPPLPADELLELISKDAGKELTLAQLNELAARLTRRMREKGYPVAFAYLPAQEVRDGVVEIAVAPGKYGGIVVRGAKRIAPERLAAMFSAARSGDVITQNALERALLLMNDLSGVTVSATLAPAQTPGAADVILTVTEKNRVSGMVIATNFGTRYIGCERGAATISVPNLRGQGDELTFDGLTSAGGRMNFYSSFYRTPLGYDGAQFSVQHFKVDYTLGDIYAALGATGKATVAAYRLKYPLIRSRAFSLYGDAGYDVKHLRDDMAFSDDHAVRRSGIGSIGFSGRFRDDWLGGGVTDFSLTYYNGDLAIKDQTTAQSDATAVKTAGRFAKTTLAFQRRRLVAENLQLTVDFSGQIAAKNLDASEKFSLGGPVGVRAFPLGEAPGDQGYLLSGELRWRLPGLSAKGSDVSLIGFFDYGSVMVNKRPWAGAGDNRRSLMGAGLGLRWTKADDFMIFLDYAWKIGREVATADKDRNGRFWLRGIKFF